MNTKIVVALLISLFLFPLVSSRLVGVEINIPSVPRTNIYQGNLTNFTELADTPNSYAGQSGNCVVVNGGETALEFSVCAAGSADGQKDTSGPYLYNDSGTVYYNETHLNLTIDNRAGGTENATWNESRAFNLFAPNTTSGIQILLNYTSLVLNTIFSLDWTNVTITESQITDLSHTTDTNETDRLTNLTLTDCPTGNYTYGIDTNGSVVCRDDLQGSGTTDTNCSDGSCLPIFYWTNQSYLNETLALESINNSAYSQNTTTNLQSLFYSALTWIINFTNIYSLDWSNVTITTSQITDYSATSDTNCSDGSCLPVFYWANQSYLNETDIINSINTTANILLLEADPNWAANFTNLQDDCSAGNYSYGVYNNGTLKCRSDISGAAANCEGGQCGALFYWANQSYLNETDLINSINTTDNIVLLEQDPEWDANFTNMQDDCAAGNYSYGIYSNGTFKCRDDTGGAGSGDVINNTLGWILNFTNIFSLDWTNITITESQITDLTHTTDTDTNASTACGVGEYLDGSGKCINFNVTAQSWDTNISDTNESDRMVFLVQDDCPAGNYSYGVQENGTLLCRDDVTSVGDAPGDGNASSICGNGEYLDGSGSCINFNQTVTLLDTNITDTNISNWSKADLNTLFNDTQWWNKTYADTLYFDTNASTCGDGEYLDGDGTCINLATTIVSYDTNISDTNETERLINLNATVCPEGNYTYAFQRNGTPLCRDDTSGIDTTCDDGSCDTILYWANQSYLNETDLANSINTTANFQSLFNTIVTWIMNFTGIYSTDWSNVTITESQITDLSHTVDTDTNASTECNVGEYLDGSGKCINFNITAQAWDTNISDTNETTRIINLNATVCPDGNYTYAFQRNGTPLCRDDEQGSFTDTNCSDGSCNTILYWANQSYLNETDLANSINTTTNFQSLFNTIVTWIMNFSGIYSTNWSNVTITESQITDLSHTTDTNISNWSRSDLDNIYITISNESTLNVSHANLWNDSISGYNTTQFNIVEGLLNILESWLLPLIVSYDTNLSEDNVEDYIFDNDNTNNLNMSNYNLTGVDCILFESGGNICDQN